MCFHIKEYKYLKDGRLEDVLALIQVLALDKDSHRSEEGVKSELPALPNSAGSWLQLAKEHQEFFRVVEDRKFPISLVTRHVSSESGEKRPPLSPEHTQALLNSAIELHDRQIRRSQRWTVLIPIWVAVIGGAIAIFKVLAEGGSA
jgi:Flp pilus assembly protein CpaB